MCTRTRSPQVLAGKVKQCERLSTAHLGDSQKLVRWREGKKEMMEMCGKCSLSGRSLRTPCSDRGCRQRLKGWVVARHRALTLCSSPPAVQAPRDVLRPRAAPGKPLAERLSMSTRARLQGRYSETLFKKLIAWKCVIQMELALGMGQKCGASNLLIWN